jgi:hypothetical protein
LVGHEPVDLLRHPAIEAPEPGFDMRGRDVELGADDGARQSRIGVAVKQHAIRALLEENNLKAFDHLASLLSVGTGTDAQVGIGRRDTQFGEEDRAHVVVVMLSGVNDQVVHRH